MSRKTKHSHLLPLLSFVPLIGVMLLISYSNWQVTPLGAGLIALAYLLANVVFGLIKGTFKAGYIIEYGLIGLLFYFVAVMYV